MEESMEVFLQHPGCGLECATYGERLGTAQLLFRAEAQHPSQLPNQGSGYLNGEEFECTCMPKCTVRGRPESVKLRSLQPREA